MYPDEEVGQKLVLTDPEEVGNDRADTTRHRNFNQETEERRLISDRYHG